MPEPEKRRRRPAVSCTLCRKRKIRCNRESPCSNCIRSKTPHTACVYDNLRGLPPRPKAVATPDQQPALAPRPVPATQDIVKSNSISVEEDPGYLTQKCHPEWAYENVGARPSRSPAGLTPPSQASPHDVDTMKSRIAQLEAQLSNLKSSGASPITPNTANTSVDDKLEDDESSYKELHAVFNSEIFGETQFTSRCLIHKRRLFGQSHWGNCLPLFRDLFETFEKQDAPGHITTVSCGINDCKEVARKIKAHRAGPWPSLPNTDVPPREVCDKLLDGYFRTIESVYRIIHIPSFKKEYETFWTQVSNSQMPSMSMIVPLKLAMAIGSTVYDKEFSLRATAVRWIHEAEAWLCRPDYKGRITICAVQSEILLTFARESCGLAWGQTWVSIGNLLRTAIYIGLHRDPSKLPRRTVYASQLRRRLWATILELVVRTSLNSGAPPLLSVDEFDTEPPGNFNDDQLLEENPEAKPADEFTQSSMARAMNETFTQRLAIVKSLNGINANDSYDHTLRLENDLRIAHKAVCRTIQSLKSTRTAQSLAPSAFQLSYLDMVMRRFILSAHVPWFGPSLNDPAYAYTRKLAIDNTLALWRITRGRSNMANADPSYNDFVLMAAYRPGFLCAGVMQSSHIQLAEIRAQLRENDDDISGVFISSDLRPILDEALQWSFQMLLDGETNIKGHLLTTLLIEQIKAAMAGVSPEEIPGIFFEALAKQKDRCLHLLQEGLARERAERASTETPFADPSADPLLEDWDFSIPDPDFSTGLTTGLGGLDTMTWIFDDAMLQTPQFY